ncbi:BLUF domain-containing protein [Kordiimonas aquimaris]|uniref:BLUF domain-containing protein n=1 Tax=Kordiimonas aquimaris TaxID=707591 RepID=UPI0021D0DEFF|nr:BLUF domain-containing protein [Kordiimonas aquimaris]
MLEALVYVSAANPEISDSDVEDILEVAKRNNFADQLTGALIFTGTLFVQLLEGNPRNLDQRMRSIVLDDRHSAVIALARGSITQRQFPSWSMAYRAMDGLTADRLHAQVGWDNSVKKLLDTIPYQHSINSLTTIFESILDELQH